MLTKERKRSISILEYLIILITVLFSIMRILIYPGLRGFNCNEPGPLLFKNCSSPVPWPELLWLLGACLAAIFLMMKLGLFPRYLKAWKAAWVVLLFLGVILSSTIWSVFPAATFFRALSLIMITFLAAFIGIRWSLWEVVDILAWVMAILAVLSCIAVFLLPGIGTMSNPPYIGSWTGIFWHRNYLGTMMALASMVFLVRLLASGKSTIRLLINGFFYGLSMALVVKSRSATGLILAGILTSVCLLFYLWTIIRSKIKPKGYLIIGLSIIVLFVVAILKIETLLGLLGRNTTFTGRVPLWIYLLENYIYQRPWLGYGYGVFWSYEQVRNQTQAVLGWMYPVLIGDNGWMDMFLHLGGLGIILFVLFLIQFGILSVKNVIREKSVVSFFPVLLLIFTVIGNITLSLFLELESFTWVLMIATLFSIWSMCNLVEVKDNSLVSSGQ